MLLRRVLIILRGKRENCFSEIKQEFATVVQGIITNNAMSWFHGTACKRQCGSIAANLSRLDACEHWNVVHWCRTQVSSQNLQGVVDGRVDEVCVITAALGIQVWSYSPTVAMSLPNTPSTDCQSLSACMIAGSSAYACVLETVVGESEMQVLKRRGTKTDPCGTQLIC